MAAPASVPILGHLLSRILLRSPPRSGGPPTIEEVETATDEQRLVQHFDLALQLMVDPSLNRMMTATNQELFRGRLLEYNTAADQLTAHLAQDVAANARSAHNAITPALVTQKSLAAESLNPLRLAAKPFFDILCAFADGLHLSSDVVLTSLRHQDHVTLYDAVRLALRLPEDHVLLHDSYYLKDVRLRFDLDHLPQPQALWTRLKEVHVFLSKAFEGYTSPSEAQQGRDFRTILLESEGPYRKAAQLHDNAACATGTRSMFVAPISEVVDHLKTFQTNFPAKWKECVDACRKLPKGTGGVGLPNSAHPRPPRPRPAAGAPPPPPPPPAAPLPAAPALPRGTGAAPGGTSAGRPRLALDQDTTEPWWYAKLGRGPLAIGSTIQAPGDGRSVSVTGPRYWRHCIRCDELGHNAAHCTKVLSSSHEQDVPASGYPSVCRPPLVSTVRRHPRTHCRTPSALHTTPPVPRFLSPDHSGLFTLAIDLDASR